MPNTQCLRMAQCRLSRCHALAAPSSKLLLAQVSSPVELEQCDEETLAAILGTDAKVSICLHCSTGIYISQHTLFHDMRSSAAENVICKLVCMSAAPLHSVCCEQQALIAGLEVAAGSSSFECC